MNSHCSICDVEQQCGYEYKPCDCCNYRKFKPKPQEAKVIQLVARPSKYRTQPPKEAT